MHRIHVRTGYVEVPEVNAHDERPTHDVFVIPTGPNERVMEIETFDLGMSLPPQGPPVPGARWTRMRRWRFRAVSVEQADGPLDSDIVVDMEVSDSEGPPKVERGPRPALGWHSGT